MTVPESHDTLLAPCPSEEEIAAFLDGGLSAEERARITAHLAGCPGCYEVFAGVAHFLSEGGEATPDDPAAQLIPYHRNLQRRAWRSARWRHAAAAAAAVIAAIVVPVYWWLTIPPPMLVADLAAPLIGASRIASRLRDTHIMRGDRGKTGLLSTHLSFLIGVFELDLRLSMAAGDVERFSRIVFHMGALLRDANFMQKEGEFYQAAAARLRSAQALRRLAVASPAYEAALIGKKSSLLADWVAFGK